jgi:hypothetical protein
MDVICYAGACGPAKVHAQIKSLGSVNLAQNGLRTLGEVHHLVADLLVGRVKLSDVLARRDHQMTADVGIEIEDYETVGSTMEDEILLVVGRILMGLAKDTLNNARHFGSTCRDIRVSPGAPESFHGKDLVRPELKAGRVPHSTRDSH